jgi:hypothetical protein
LITHPLSEQVNGPLAAVEDGKDRQRRPPCLRTRAAGCARTPGASNELLAPHLGSAVKPLRESLANVMVDNVIASIEGRPPQSTSAEKAVLIGFDG